MTIATSPDCVTSDRDGIVENRHYVHIAVVDEAGKILFSAGNPSRVTLVRSTAKPAQALAVLETGGFEQSGFDDGDLALMCASHSSEDLHLNRARRMLAKAGAEESDLRCGGHASISEAVNRAWIKADFVPTGICNNCSGKHAGMLAGARALGAGYANYHLPDHPMQTRVKRVVTELSGLDTEHVQWGNDGCNLPAPAMPLWALGKTYAAFAAAADAWDSSEQAGSAVPVRMAYMARIFHAMARYPDLVAGQEGRFCTELMRAFDGALIGKLGADGCYGVGIRASEETAKLGAKGAIGISVKVEDGNIEILYATVVETLAQLGIEAVESRKKLSRFHDLKRTNTMGVTVGHVSFDFRLQPKGH